MATRPRLTEAEAAVAIERLMDELFPNRAAYREHMSNGRTFEESMGAFADRRKLAGGWLPDDDFARDVEEGRRLMREGSRDWE